MSEITTDLLETSHKGVHEQLDFLVAAMHVQFRLMTSTAWDNLQHQSDRKRKKWFKEEASQRFRELGYSPGFLQRNLLLHVFLLYDAFYANYTKEFPTVMEKSILEIQFPILLLAATHLDKQFRDKGYADVCSFLEMNSTTMSALDISNSRAEEKGNEDAILTRIAYLLDFFDGKFGKDKHVIAGIFRESLNLPIELNEPDLGHMWWSDPVTNVLRIGFSCNDFKNRNTVDGFGISAYTNELNFDAIGTCPRGDTGWWTISEGPNHERITPQTQSVINAFWKLGGWSDINFGGSYRVLQRPKAAT